VWKKGGAALKKRMRDISLKCKGTHMEESFEIQRAKGK
jgi:hypothetical protein